MASTLGQINPLRYRGYVYDSETGLYYLQSRYYNPETSRYISADGQLNPNASGSNQFAYCSNNPVSRIDADGNDWNDFVKGANDGFIGFYADLWHSVSHPVETIKSQLTVEAYLTGVADVVTMGMYSTSKKGQALGKAVQTGDDYGAGKVVGNTAGEASFVAASYGMSKGVSKVAGNVSTKYLDSIIENPSKIQSQSLTKVKIATKLSPKYQGSALTKGAHAGQGFKSTTGTDKLIQWHPGSRWHFNGQSYWKVSSGASGTQRFLYKGK